MPEVEDRNGDEGRSTCVLIAEPRVSCDLHSGEFKY